MRVLFSLKNVRTGAVIPQTADSQYKLKLACRHYAENETKYA